MSRDWFHPGEYLAEELKARGWTEAGFAKSMKVPIKLVKEIIAEREDISPEIAKKLEKALGSSAQMWLNLQKAWDEREQKS